MEVDEKMFMQIAMAAIGIGIVVMIGFIVLSQVRTALPTPLATYNNTCFNRNLTYCNAHLSPNCYPLTAGQNTTSTITCTNKGYLSGTNTAQATIFAGLALIAVGIIVLGAFALINVFK